MFRLISVLLLFSAFFSCEEMQEFEALSAKINGEENVEDSDFGTSINIEFSDNLPKQDLPYFFNPNIQVGFGFSRSPFPSGINWHLRSIFFTSFWPYELDLYAGSIPTVVKYYYVDQELHAEIEFGIIFSSNKLTEVSHTNNTSEYKNSFNAFDELIVTDETIYHNFVNQYGAIALHDFSDVSDTLQLESNGYHSAKNAVVIYKRKVLMKNDKKSVEFAWIGDADLAYYNNGIKEKTNIRTQEKAKFPSRVNQEVEKNNRSINASFNPYGLYIKP